MKLLLSGDLHIGRASTQVPEHVGREHLRTARVWEDRLVDLAIRERVNAVCLSGDVADEANKFWEAIGPLERGVGRLAEAGIMVLAVSGNHDHDVLATLADNLPPDRFRLLGRGGDWERVTLPTEGRAALHVDGWSFPAQRVETSPLDSYALPPASVAPVLGLVHGDLGVPDSRYAPLDKQRLASLPPHCWLLGHIHTPQQIDDAGPGWALYPGSPQALDPGEPGAHGVWIVDVEPGGIGEPRFRPLSSVRYEPLTVELDGDVRTADDFQTRLHRAIREQAGPMVEASGPALRCLSLRLEIRGRSPIAHEVPALLDALPEQFEDYRLGDVPVVIDRATSSVRPAIDLAELAEDRSALGTAARLLLELEKDQPAEDVARLIQRARQTIRDTRDGRSYADLPDDPPVTEALARRYLRDRASALLGELHEQVTP